jgi:hypothetical protein
VPLTLTSPIADPAGNARASFTASLKFLAVGAPRATWDFESPVASWNANLVAAPEMGCTGACAKIGPVSLSVCGAGRAGLAVRTPAASSIAVRYRMVVDTPSDRPESTIYGNVLSIDVATPGSAAVTTPVTFDSTTLKPFEGGAAKATDWITVSAPGGSTELGVAVRAGDRAFDGECGGFAPLPAQVTFYVDSIIAK